MADPGDLDIAVMFTPHVDSFEAALALQVDLERVLDLPVDVHDFDALPSDLQFFHHMARALVAEGENPATPVHGPAD